GVQRVLAGMETGNRLASQRGGESCPTSSARRPLLTRRLTTDNTKYRSESGHGSRRRRLKLAAPAKASSAAVTRVPPELTAIFPPHMPARRVRQKLLQETATSCALSWRSARAIRAPIADTPASISRPKLKLPVAFFE